MGSAGWLAMIGRMGRIGRIGPIGLALRLMRQAVP
jgi:hypothetical protein